MANAKLAPTPRTAVISVGVNGYDRCGRPGTATSSGFELVYELEEYGWCELQTQYIFNIGLGQTETVAQGNITPTFDVHDIDAAIADVAHPGRQG